ncbi:MAG: hypothetical protein K8T90_12975 [Planctomycetes bacterium]|nr:hypothetical protein [Planctomycetota bacterium]
MQLFYHGTRDIELPTAGRGALPSAGSRQCEACGQPLPGGDLSEATGNRLAFCADCRKRVDRSAIQIHFCDACGVSVPLEAVEEGRALAPDGRILCVACHTPPADRPGTIFWAVVAAAAALAIGALAASLS